MMLEDQIAGEEILYRRVPDDKGLLKELPDGTVRISSQAFTERTYRPSVNRAKLHGNDPQKTLRSDSDGVTSIITFDVRNIKDLETFLVDVEPKPIFDDPYEPDNLAHAEIYISPPECPRRLFRKLCEKLALLANSKPWEIKPLSLRKPS